MRCHRPKISPIELGKDISLQSEPKNCLGFQDEPLKNGNQMEKLPASEQRVITEDTLNQKLNVLLDGQILPENVTSATVESQPVPKKKIWRDKSNTLEVNSQTMKLSEIMDQVSILKERVLTPFWNQHSRDISQKLWLPTEIGSVGLVLNSLKRSSRTNRGESWFSIKHKHPPRKNSLMTSFQLSQYFLPDSMDSGVTHLKRKLEKKPVKTLKIKIFPTIQEKEKLNLIFQQYRWYYNATLSIVNKEYGESLTEREKYSYSHIRDLVRKYRYEEERTDDKVIRNYIKENGLDKVPTPDWWEGKVHSRIPRGAAKKFTGNLNSSLSNFKVGNIKKFKMNFLKGKNRLEHALFEDKNYPKFIRNIKGRYWYTTKSHKRVKISLNEITSKEKGLELLHDKEKDTYFIHYPVPRDWFPEDDRRNDKQVRLNQIKERVISLDPGVRKFLVGMIPRENQCL